MAITTINVGSAPNDGTGDSLRTSFTICNDNFDYLESIISGNGNIYANSLTISGNVLLGQPLSFTALNANLQYAGTANTYVQMIIQNKSNASIASTDIVATADNGTDFDTYIDMGITGSGYNDPEYDLWNPNDGYLIVYGNTTTIGGNLVLSTLTDKDIVFSTNGASTSNEIGRWRHGTGLIVSANTMATGSSTGAFQVAGGASITGNVYVDDNLNVGNGVVLTGQLTSAFTNGVAIDYTSGNGRISLGSTDGLIVYNGGLAGTQLMALTDGGNLTVSNVTITGNINGSVGLFTNLILSTDLIAANTSQGFSMSGPVNPIAHTVGNAFAGGNATTINSEIIPRSQAISAFNINANVTMTYGNISSGVEKRFFLKNVSGSSANVILPNANNNKGSNVVLINSGITASITLTSVDTTAANVIATIINN